MCHEQSDTSISKLILPYFRTDDKIFVKVTNGELLQSRKQIGLTKQILRGKISTQSVIMTVYLYHHVKFRIL